MESWWKFITQFSAILKGRNYTYWQHCESRYLRLCKILLRARILSHWLISTLSLTNKVVSLLLYSLSLSNGQHLLYPLLSCTHSKLLLLQKSHLLPTTSKPSRNLISTSFSLSPDHSYFHSPVFSHFLPTQARSQGSTNESFSCQYP